MVTVIPIDIGTLGRIPKGLTKALKSEDEPNYPNYSIVKIG